VKGEEEASENYSASHGLVGVGYLQQTCSLQDEILALVGAGSYQSALFGGSCTGGEWLSSDVFSRGGSCTCRGWVSSDMSLEGMFLY